MAGLWAGVLLKEFGRSVVVIRKGTGATSLSSGVIDIGGPAFPGPHVPLEDCISTEQNLRRTLSMNPYHPYHLVCQESIIDKFDETIKKFLIKAREASLPMLGSVNECMAVINNHGTFKFTNIAQHGCHTGNILSMKKAKLCFIGISGLASLLPGPAAQSLKFSLSYLDGDYIDQVESTQVGFSGTEDGFDLSPYTLAKRLDDPGTAEGFAKRAKEKLGRGSHTIVGFPPVLGLSDHPGVINTIREKIGIEVFETISTTPSVPGLRLQRAMERMAEMSGIEIVSVEAVRALVSDGSVSSVLTKVNKKEKDPDQVHGSDNEAEVEMSAKSFILSSGRYISGGLKRGDTIKESIFDLPVFSGGRRVGRLGWEDLVDRNFLQRQGLFSCGIRVDHNLRPVDEEGEVIYRNLFAAGSIIGGYDYVHEGCGLGMALITAQRAAEEVG